MVPSNIQVIPLWLFSHKRLKLFLLPHVQPLPHPELERLSMAHTILSPLSVHSTACHLALCLGAGEGGEGRGAVLEAVLAQHREPSLACPCCVGGAFLLAGRLCLLLLEGWSSVCCWRKRLKLPTKQHQDAAGCLAAHFSEPIGTWH